MKFVKKIIRSFGRVEKRSVDQFPSNVLLEPTNACNLRCRMCPAYGEGVERKRDIGFINREVWTKALDEIGTWPSRVNLDLHGAGEPLLHPDFLDMLAHARSKKNITVGFLSNATLLNREMASAIMDIGLDWICFSVDGAEKHIFEHYRKGADFDLVEENIKYLLSIRKGSNPVISFNMVRHQELDVKMFIDKWSGLVDVLNISLKRLQGINGAGGLKLLTPCALIYQQLPIAWTGKAGLCCEDFWLDHVIGTFPEESLYEIWHGKLLNNIRKKHEKQQADDVKLCRTCNATFLHLHKEWFVEKGRINTLIREELPEMRPEIAVKAN
ncbi:MAG: radical SAM protein [Nitrospirae bacterium]|nr:radical SAM protein [Nitrospirota bacterium]